MATPSETDYFVFFAFFFSFLHPFFPFPKLSKCTAFIPTGSLGLNLVFSIPSLSRIGGLQTQLLAFELLIHFKHVWRKLERHICVVFSLEKWILHCSSCSITWLLWQVVMWKLTLVVLLNSPACHWQATKTKTFLFRSSELTLGPKVKHLMESQKLIFKKKSTWSRLWFAINYHKMP